MFEATPMASFVFELRFWLGVPERGMSRAEQEQAARAAKSKASVVAFLLIAMWMMKCAGDHRFTAVSAVGSPGGAVVQRCGMVGAVMSEADSALQARPANGGMAPLLSTDADYDPPVPIE